MTTSSPLIYFLRNGSPVLLRSGKVLGGGEGRVYQIESGIAQARLKAAKIYLDAQRAARVEPKISHMIACAPQSAMSGPSHRGALVWPQMLLYDANGAPAGYIMPWVGGATEMEELCLPATPSQPCFHPFAFDRPGSMLRRLRTLHAIAQALAQLHAGDRYVWGDLKAQNIMVRPDASIAFIDMDSIQICEGNALRFPTRVVSDEAAPPEHHDGRINVASQRRETHWDTFSFAVCAYRLLFGIHPYLATFNGVGHITLADAIEQGLFVHGRQRRQVLVLPNPHRAFAQLPATLRNLFMRALDDGHDHPDRRPSAAEWQKALKDLVAHPSSALRKACLGDFWQPSGGAACEVTTFGVHGAINLDLDWNEEFYATPDGQLHAIGKQLHLRWQVPGARRLWFSALAQHGGSGLRASMSGCYTQAIYEDKELWLLAHFGGLKFAAARIHIPVEKLKASSTVKLDPVLQPGATTALNSTLQFKARTLCLSPELRLNESLALRSL